MIIEWGFLWRTVVFHIVWWILSPFAAMITTPRGMGGWDRARDRMDSVYDSLYKKYVIRPRLGIEGVSDTDLEDIIYLTQIFPVSLKEAASSWDKNERMMGKTLVELRWRYRLSSG